MKKQNHKLLCKAFLQQIHHQKSSKNFLYQDECVKILQEKPQIITQTQGQEKLKELAEENDRIEKYQKLSYFKRSRSSQSVYEGYFNSKAQQVFLYLPYHFSKEQKRIQIKKLWKKYFNVIRALFRYSRARYDKYKFYIPKKKLYSLPTPETLIMSPKKRKKDVLQKLSTFGEYIQAQIDNEEKSKRKEEPKFKKSPIYLKYKASQVRIGRILQIRNNSLTDQRVSPIIRKKGSNQTLPPLFKLDRRLQRVFSNQMIKMPQVYKLDLENSFIKRFERSQLSRSLKSSQVTRVRLQLQKQPRFKVNQFLKELSEWNETKKHHIKLKYYPRGKSSEASIEGNTSKKMQQIFLLLPYHCSSQQKKHQCRRMWKRLILGVEVILFYRKLYKEQLLSKTASCPHIPPRRSSLKSLNYPSSPKRKLRSRTQQEGKVQHAGFGDYIKAMYESEKLKKEICSRSVIAKEFRSNDSRIKRLVTSKITDYTLDLSRNRCISSKDPLQLPPLMQPAPYKEENSRIKRVSSTLIRRIRTQRQY